MRLIACGKTDVGVTRTKNEDYFCSEDGIGLFVVADGMGGHASGEIASKMAVEIIRDHMSSSLPEKDSLDSGKAVSFSNETRALASGILESYICCGLLTGDPRMNVACGGAVLPQCGGPGD